MASYSNSSSSSRSAEGRHYVTDEGNLLENAANAYFNDKTEENIDALVNAAKRFINYFASIYGGGYSMDDIRQAGMEGYIKAIKNFNPSFGVKFSTYAGYCIIGGIRHFVRKEMQYYRPCVVADLHTKIDSYIEESFRDNETAPSITEIAQKFNIKEVSVAQIMRAGLVSYDKVEAYKIVNRREESFKLILEDRIMIEQALKQLTDIQRKVINLLFFRGLSQKDASDKLGLNQRKVSRIKEKSIFELRKILAK